MRGALIKKDFSKKFVVHAEGFHVLPGIRFTPYFAAAHFPSLSSCDIMTCGFSEKLSGFGPSGGGDVGLPSSTVSRRHL
jgi:hypothetical protein